MNRIASSDQPLMRRIVDVYAPTLLNLPTVLLIELAEGDAFEDSPS
jgi:hypothetical protein